jgi:hypothetical protein
LEGIPLKTKREKARKALILVFLGLTISLAAILSYTVYLYVGVALLFNNFDSNLSVDRVEIPVDIAPSPTNITITINNPFAGSYLDITYIAIKELMFEGAVFDLSQGGVPLSGTFTGVYVPALSSRQVRLSFSLPSPASSYTPDPQAPSTITLAIRVHATTIINEGQLQRIDLVKNYTGNQ